MQRRDFLQAGAASLLIPALTGQAHAAQPADLDERLLLLQDHVARLQTRQPSPVVAEGLEREGMAPGLLSNILAGLLVADSFKAATPAEQEDPRWAEVMGETLAVFTRDMATLLTWLEQRPALTRVQRRLLRRPNKLARAVELGLVGKRSEGRRRELRRGLAAMSSFADEDLLGDSVRDFDAVAEANETSRFALAQHPQTPEEANRLFAKRLLIGVLLLLAVVPVFFVGVFLVASAVDISPLLAIPGVLFCLAALACLVLGVVFLIWAVVGIVRYSIEGDDEVDAELMATVEDLMVA